MNKLYYYNLIAESLKKEFSLDIQVKFKNIQRGHARKNYISIPKWALKNKFYGIYYLLHELNHIILFNKLEGWKHGKAFQESEKRLLARFNLKAENKGRYAERIFLNDILVFDFQKDIKGKA